LATAPEDETGEAQDGTDAAGPDLSDTDPAKSDAAIVTGVIERSPESARLILIASNTFASDAALDLASRGIGTPLTKPVEFLQNAIDWSLEDRDLLALRGHTQFARTLAPLTEGERRLWEYLNYGLALAGLLAVWGWRRWVRAADRARYRQILAEV